jgi:fucose 4-O-acetylase-like acetyltransferase
MTMGVRYHSLDALRASMMLLGLVLHSMASYAATPLGDGWPYQDARTSAHFDRAMFVIHLFRMPAFFAVAGFFAALLYDRDGEAGFLRNRARRVLAPLIIFWATVGPLVLAGLYFAITYSGLMSGDELLASVSEPGIVANLSPMHLWFLWYLVLFYAATVVIVRLAGNRGVAAPTAARMTTSWWSLPLWTALTTVTLLPMTHPGIDASPLLFPNPRTVIAYGVFFLFGWILYRGRAELTRLTQWWSWRVPAAIAAVAVPSYLVMERFSSDRGITHAVGCVLIAVATWGLVLASFGAFLRYAARPHPLVRYLSDSSYWIYIIHLPIVITIAGVLSRASLHAGIKFAVVLTLTTIACVATYQLFVRRTVIGQLLNGRRFRIVAAEPPRKPTLEVAD